MTAQSSFAIEVPAQTLEAARAGDAAAQRTLYELFERPVYTLALRLCQNADDAHDALQDCFVNALSRLDQFAGDAPFWGWLRRVAINTTLQRLRAGQRYRLRVASVEDVEVVSQGRAETPGDQVDLVRAFARLSETARTVVWLHDVEGLKHREIADMMDKTVSFSKSQLARGRSRLRELLDATPEPTPCPQLRPTA